MAAAERTGMAEALGSLRPKQKAPSSCRTLDAWVAAAERELGVRGGRVGWLVATTLVSAKLQQVVDGAGGSRFALKGGTLLQYRLGIGSRAGEAAKLGLPARTLPTEVVERARWESDYGDACASVGFELPLGEAIQEINEWIASIGVGIQRA